MNKIQITTPGVKKALKRYHSEKAIAEYLWNGFDAQSTEIFIEFDSDEMGHLDELRIIDNGYGIQFEDLATKFTPFFESEKEIDPEFQRGSSAIHGKNGVGRLTFFQFATHAEWVTVFETNNKRYRYTISINADKLETFSPTELVETDEPTGTTVTFKGIVNITASNLNTNIKLFLMKEFGWFLELNKEKDFAIIINGDSLNYYDLIGDEENHNFTIEKRNFSLRYIRWNAFINEYSRYYCTDSNGIEKFKRTTTMNNKGDRFYHSVFVKSDFFNNFSESFVDSDNLTNQLQLFETDEQEKIFNEVVSEIDRYLREKRKPFLKNYTKKLIAEYEDEGIFPKYKDNPWDKIRKKELENFITELYQVEPKIFSKLNTEQKKTFVRLMDLVMDTGEREKLFEIIDGIVKLQPAEREQFAKSLKISNLSHIIKTINLIEDRFKAISDLQELVFNKDLKANERDHVQKYVENHYWIFGEQYHLVTAAEPKFEKALRRFVYLLTGEDKDTKIDHPDKNREMDIFMVRQDQRNSIINNVVVELKHPTLGLGEEELSQVKKYMNVILSTDEFNASNMTWEFYLVGNKYDTSNYIKREMENAAHHGENSLVFKTDRYKIYVKTWSELLTEFELRHKFLYEKLKLKRENLIQDFDDADQIIQAIEDNSAIQDPEVEIV